MNELRARMMEASRRGRAATNPAEKYRWIGVWWKLQSRESMNPTMGMTAARNMFRLSADMMRRPEHYQQKPPEVTDWQHSGFGIKDA